MQNHLALLRGDDLCETIWGTRGYPIGTRTVRRFHLYVNGVKLVTFMDHNPATAHKCDRDLDQIIEAEVALYEEALKCKCVRGRIRDRRVVSINGRVPA